MQMNSWYDIQGLGEHVLREDMMESARYVCSLIDEYDASVIGGFSQGGAISLLTAFSVWEKPLDGVIAFSAYAAPFEKKRDVPHFIYHGEADPLIQIGHAKHTYSSVL